jgi:hypothetical protein
MRKFKLVDVQGQIAILLWMFKGHAFVDVYGRLVRLLTVYFGAPSMFITLWFGFDYGTNPPLGTLII